MVYYHQPPNETCILHMFQIFSIIYSFTCILAHDGWLARKRRIWSQRASENVCLLCLLWSGIPFLNSFHVYPDWWIKQRSFLLLLLNKVSLKSNHFSTQLPKYDLGKMWMVAMFSGKRIGLCLSKDMVVSRWYSIVPNECYTDNVRIIPT